MKWRKLFPALLMILTLLPLFGIILPTSSVVGADGTTASSSQSGLIKVALTKNVAPRSDWSNGTLYHLRILQKFIPIDITVITNFATLGDHQVLFLNILNISDTDIASIRNWVSTGGILVCIGQSGRYTENGEEQNSHPFETVLGITLNAWERTSGAEVRQILINNTWHWWTSDVVYEVANNGDGNYHELVDYHYVPKSECVNVTLNDATQIMSCRDKNRTSYFDPNATFPMYEEPFLTTNTYGSGRAFFIAADVFYRLVWKPPRIGIGLHDLYSNFMKAGYWFRSSLLWQTLYAIMLDCFSDIPLLIITSMPHGSYTAMSFGIKTTGGGAEDKIDDNAYGNLTQYWQPQIFDKQPMLKGWFWGFWLMTRIIDGTSNASNIVNFVNEYGYAGSRGEGNLSLEAFAESSEILRNHNFTYNYEGSAGGPVGIWDVTTMVKNWSFTDIFYYRRISGRTEHGAFISSIPCPISDHAGVTNFFFSPYASSQPHEWGWLIERQKLLGQDYGIGGYCTGTNYEHWIGYIPHFNETINTFIDDDTVWKTSGQLFVDWWDKRWQVNMTDFSANSTRITIDLQTPEIENLTLLIKEMADPYHSITVDGTPLTLLPESNRIVIPSLSEGGHRIVIKFAKIFATPELKQYNDQLKAEGKPYVLNSTHVIKYLNYANQRLSLTLDLPTNATAELKVNSTYSPRQAFTNGQPPQSLAYVSNIATLVVGCAHVDIYYAQPKISRFSSSKLEYGTEEGVRLTLEIYGDHSTSEPLEWLARVTVLDGTQEIVNVTKQVEISTAEATIRDFTVEKLSERIYTIIAEMLDPEAPGNVLAMNSLTISVTEIPTAPLIFDPVELKEYNNKLKSEDLPYVEVSTQTIVDLTFSNAYQRLSMILGVHPGVNTELKVYSCSPYSPCQAFADGQPISFTYRANIATMLIPYAHVDIYYAQPKIIQFSSSKPSYEPDEDVELTLEAYGDYSTSGIIKWLIRFTIEDETEKIVKTGYEEIELNATQSLALQLAAGKFSEGIYTITVEMIDLEAENVLETQSLIIKVAEAPILLPLILVILTTILAIIGTAVYVWYRLKKPKIAKASVHTFT